MYVLAALTLLIGVVIVASTLRKRRATPRPPGAEGFASLVGGLLVVALGLGIGFLAADSTRWAQQEAENERIRASLVNTAPAAAPSAPVSAGESVPPVAPARTDLQNLAIIAGRTEADPELASGYARLQALCPPEPASIGDMVVTMQRLVREKSGREMDLVEVMRQLAIAQEGGQTAGMKCSETGGMLVELLIKGL